MRARRAATAAADGSRGGWLDAQPFRARLVFEGQAYSFLHRQMLRQCKALRKRFGFQGQVDHTS